jgi:hypothetical protein
MKAKNRNICLVIVFLFSLSAATFTSAAEYLPVENYDVLVFSIETDDNSTGLDDIKGELEVKVVKIQNQTNGNTIITLNSTFTASVGKISDLDTNYNYLACEDIYKSLGLVAEKNNTIYKNVTDYTDYVLSRSIFLPVVNNNTNITNRSYVWSRCQTVGSGCLNDPLTYSNVTYTKGILKSMYIQTALYNVRFTFVRRYKGEAPSDGSGDDGGFEIPGYSLLYVGLVATFAVAAVILMNKKKIFKLS